MWVTPPTLDGNPGGTVSMSRWQRETLGRRLKSVTEGVCCGGQTRTSFDREGVVVAVV
jgi:hypothetical protein